VDFLDVAPVRARLWLAFDAAGTLHALQWSPAESRVEDVFGGRDPGRGGEPGRLPELQRDLLERYLRGESVEPVTLAVEPQGTDFQKRVWQALRAIPRGHVRSYAGIAAAIGKPRATRAVGSANGKNPIAIAIPCHRVVETGMQLGGYTGGLSYKRFLLELEGVRVVGDHVQPGQLDLL
jgi:O-6-methylguanine DNA methyltransferase